MSREFQPPNYDSTAPFPLACTACVPKARRAVCPPMRAMAVVASLALAACAPIAGLDKYSSGECTGACLDATTGAKPSDTPRTEGMPGMATTPGQGVDAEAGATPQEDAPTSPNGDADQGSAPEGGGT